MNKERLSNTLKDLSLTFGPSGLETRVADKIKLLAVGLYDELIEDCFGNVILKINGTSDKAPIMISAHMDEVGFMISDIDEFGYLRFQNVGGISKFNVPGRRVKVECNDGNLIDGIISSKAIHLQTKDERKRPFKQSELAIDIGASCRGEALKYVSVGNFATFESEYVIFGGEKKFIKSKALDDRLGCAIMLEAMHQIKSGSLKCERDIYFAFSTREELGLSGALVAANRICPEFAIILETTAVSDVAGTPDNMNVAKLGDGGCVLIADRSTIYNKDLFELALGISKKENIPCQIKQYVSGGNDSGHIHKSTTGVKTIAISAPTRYLHSAACVMAQEDMFSIYSLMSAIIPKL